MSDDPDAVREFRGEGVAWVDVEADDDLAAALGVVDMESGEQATVSTSDEPGRYVLIRTVEASDEPERTEPEPERSG